MGKNIPTELTREETRVKNDKEIVNRENSVVFSNCAIFILFKKKISFSPLNFAYT